jgi:hypothetical protein
MKSTIVLALALVSVAYPVEAYPHHNHHHHLNHPRSDTDSLSVHSHITCDMVRTYVAQMGLEQARTMARAAGMTAAEERRARRCLTDKV